MHGTCNCPLRKEKHPAISSFICISAAFFFNYIGYFSRFLLFFNPCHQIYYYLLVFIGNFTYLCIYYYAIIVVIKIKHKELIMRYKTCFLYLVFILINLKLLGQDVHLSQFWLSPVSINPAVAGFFDGNARVGVYYRNQWRAISKPYQTMGAFADMPLKKRVRQQDIFSMGINIDFDQAGDSKYTSLQGSLSFAYAHALNRLNNHFIMGGITLGGVQRSWNYSQLKFDEQYHNGIYDPHIPLSEVFARNKFIFFDCGAGIAWFYQPTIEHTMQAGIGVFHLNRAHISLYKDDNIRLPIKVLAHFMGSFTVHSSIALEPNVYYAIQQKYQEFQIGLNFVYLFRFDVKWYINKFFVGLYYRWNDAVYLSTGGEWRRVKLGICYDFNVSKLTKASHVRGGIEINLSYIFKTEHTPRQQRIPCYIF